MKPKPGCIDPTSTSYGNHPWEPWGADKRFELCPRCGTTRVNEKAKGKKLSARGKAAPRQPTTREKKYVILKASQPLFPDEA